jgi:hypothetical protein
VRNLHLALIHHPVLNKTGDIICSAVTNLDLHDISRLARTYRVGSFFVVTPLQDQRQLAERLIDHWTRGAGAAYNPKRKQALEAISVRQTLEEVRDELSTQIADPADLLTVATSARFHNGSVSHGLLRQMLRENRPCLLMLGTAWGLADSVLEQADIILAPIRGDSDYNHLSVRSAAAIILDRLARVDSLP